MLERLNNIFGARSIENPARPLTSQSLVDDLVGPRGGHGMRVNEETAIALSAVWACVKVISETIASLPVHIYEREERGRRVASDHPLYPLLHRRPNRYMTAMTLWETVTAHMLLYGNAYLHTPRNNAGQVVSLDILDPTKYGVRITSTGALWLVETGREDRGFPEGHFIHFPGLSSDGLTGYSPIKVHERSLGLTMASEEYGANFFGQGATIGGVLKAPGALKPEQVERLKKQFEKNYHGGGASHKTLVLENGMDWLRVGVPPEEAQFLATRKYGVEEIARIYRVPLHKIGNLDKATFSNIEHQSLEFAQDTIRPNLVRIEQALDWHLFGEDETYFVKFELGGLLRADQRARAEFYASGITNGWLLRNEARLWEDLNPIEGGDEPLVPLNLGTEPINPNDEPDSEEENSVRELRAAREERSVSARRELQRLFEGLIAGVYSRQLKWELKRILDDLEKVEDGTIDFAEFMARLKKFYERGREAFVDDLQGVLVTYGNQIVDALGLDDDKTEAAKTQLGEFTRTYAENAREVYEGMHTGRLQYRWDNDGAPGVRDQVEQWEQDEAAFRGHTESVRANGAISKMAFVLAGFTYLVWRTVGESCPICTPLNGMTVGVQENFFNSGDVVEPGEGVSPLKMNENVSHPPIHKGCDCIVTAR